MVRYRVCRKGMKPGRAFGRLKDAKDYANNHFMYSQNGVAHEEVFIVREEVTKVWAGSFEERHRKLA